MTQPPPLPVQMTQVKIACIIGMVLGGPISLVRAGVIFDPNLRFFSTSYLVFYTFWAVCGASLAVLSVFLWNGHGWAFKPFLASSILLTFFFLDLGALFIAAVNSLSVLLLIWSSYPKHLRPPPPVNPEAAEPPPAKGEDLY